jgi:hypothetical protein
MAAFHLILLSLFPLCGTLPKLVRGGGGALGFEARFDNCQFPLATTGAQAFPRRIIITEMSSLNILTRITSPPFYSWRIFLWLWRHLRLLSPSDISFVPEQALTTLFNQIYLGNSIFNLGNGIIYSCWYLVGTVRYGYVCVSEGKYILDIQCLVCKPSMFN